MAILTVLMGAIMVMNWLAGPIAFVWLAILDEWWALGFALLSLMAPFVLGIALLTGMLLSAPALMLAEKKPAVVPLVAIPGLLYTAALMTVWCMGAFTVLLMQANSSSWVPLMLLSYSIGTMGIHGAERGSGRWWRRSDCCHLLRLTGFHHCNRICGVGTSGQPDDIMEDLRCCDAT